MGFTKGCVVDGWEVYDISQSCCKRRCCKNQLHPKETNVPSNHWAWDPKPCYDPWPCCDAKDRRANTPICKDKHEEIKEEFNNDPGIADDCETVSSFCFEIRLDLINLINIINRVFFSGLFLLTSKLNEVRGGNKTVNYIQGNNWCTKTSMVLP